MTEKLHLNFVVKYDQYSNLKRHNFCKVEKSFWLLSRPQKGTEQNIINARFFKAIK